MRKLYYRLKRLQYMYTPWYLHMDFLKKVYERTKYLLLTRREYHTCKKEGEWNNGRYPCRTSPDKLHCKWCGSGDIQVYTLRESIKDFKKSIALIGTDKRIHWQATNGRKNKRA